ncbi:MAG: hypothetical protein MUP22_06020 [Desulfobacterales bacterium]|nr:hypothetical protein [Desulfobacterales bacterium]
MKRRMFPLIILLVCSCQSLPMIQPFDKSSDEKEQEMCSIFFPKGKWQFIHSIEATMPDKKNAFIMGITNISSSTREIRIVMMTIEGLVLFDAEYKGEIKINKGISPFDSYNFANGIIEDVKLIFLLPEGRIDQAGYLKDGSHVCRYKDDEGLIVDINYKQDSTWEILKYNHYNKITRLVKTDSIIEKQGKQKSVIPQKIEMNAYGNHKYLLILDLIKAKLLSD